MWRNYSVLLAVAAFCAPIMADIVDVTFGGTATANADVGAIHSNCSPDQYYCPVEEFLSFSYDNNNQDNFMASGSVTADNRVTLSASVQQITEVSPNSLSVDLQESATVDAFGRGWGVGPAMGTGPLLMNSYQLDFTLTTESLVNTGGCSSPQSSCFLNNADSSIFIVLTDANQSFSLDRGMYSLWLHDELSGIFSPSCCGPDYHQGANSGLLFTADFTPIVPEPRWGAFVLSTTLGVMSWASWVKRRRRRG